MTLLLKLAYSLAATGLYIESILLQQNYGDQVDSLHCLSLSLDARISQFMSASSI